MKNFFRITAILLMLVLALGMLTSCGDALKLKDVEKDPYAAIVAAEQKYIDAIDTKYGKVLDAFDKMKDGTGSHELKLDVPEVGNFAVNVAADAATGAYNGKLTVGMEGLSAEAKIWGDKNNIALSIPALLGDKNYGIKLDTLMDDIKTAPILEALGMTYDDLVTALESETGVKLDDLKEMYNVEKIEEVYKKYMSDMEAIVKGKTAVVAEETVDEIDTITVEYTFDKADHEKIINTTVDMYKALLGDMVAVIDADFDEMKTEIMDSLDGNGVSVKTKYYLVKKTGVMLKTDINMTGSGEDGEANVNVTLDFSNDTAKPLNMNATVKVVDSDEEMANITFTVKESDEEGKPGVYVDVKADVEGEEVTGGFSFILDNSSNKYEFELIADGQARIAANGKLTYSEEQFSITVDSLVINGDTVALGLSYTAKAGGTVEAVPEYDNLVTMGMDAYESLITEFSESELGGVIMGLIGSSDDYYDDEYYDDEYYDDYYDDEYYDDEYYDDYYDDEYYDDEYYDDYYDDEYYDDEDIDG